MEIHSADEILSAYARGERRFTYLNLTGVDLRGADLRDANFYGSDLSGANLSGANLSRANLGMADLSHANLGDADLHEANLSGTNLSGAFYEGANLTRAILTDIVTSKPSPARLAKQPAEEAAGGPLLASSGPPPAIGNEPVPRSGVGGNIFCTYCGVRLPSDSAFCPSCGKPVAPVSAGGAHGRIPASAAAARRPVVSVPAPAPGSQPIYEHEDFVLPIPPTGQWAYARLVSPASAAAAFWTDLQPHITNKIKLLRDQGWEPETPLGPTYLTIRTAYALRNDLIQVLLISAALVFLAPVGFFMLWYRNFRGYEPEAFRVTMRRAKTAPAAAQSLPEGWLRASQVGSTSGFIPKSPILAAVLEFIFPGSGAWYAGIGATARLWFGVAVGVVLLEVVGIMLRIPDTAPLAIVAYAGWDLFRTFSIVGAVDHQNSVAQYHAMIGHVASQS